MRLEIKDLRVHYGKIEAIKGVSVVVNQGEIVTLIGANGAGKTTILKTISGLRNVTSGSITFDGGEISKIPAHERVDLGISQVPEGRGIFPGMTVLENLEMGEFHRLAMCALSIVGIGCRCDQDLHPSLPYDFYG